MGSAMSQKLVTTTATATANNTTVRFSGLEVTASAAAAATAGGQQLADPATTGLSSQGRISNIKKIIINIVSPRLFEGIIYIEMFRRSFTLNT
jgi:hypothetical protein